MILSFLIELGHAMRRQGIQIIPEQIIDSARYTILSGNLYPDETLKESLKPIFITRIEEEEKYEKAWLSFSHDNFNDIQSQDIMLYNLFKKENATYIPLINEKKSLSSGLDWLPWREFERFQQSHTIESQNAFEQAVMNALAHGQKPENWEKEFESHLYKSFSSSSDVQELEKLLEKALEFRKEFSRLKRQWNKVMNLSRYKDSLIAEQDKYGEKKSLRPEYTQGYRANLYRWGDSELFMKSMDTLKTQDIEYLKEPIRKMAERLRIRLESKRKRSGKEIDLKKTFRMARKTYGEPVKLIRQFPKRKRPRWLVLADISGSVKYATQLFLTFLLELRNIIDEDLRSFVFVSQMKEITNLLKEKNYDGNLEEIRNKCGVDLRGYSDYGYAFSQFEEQAQDSLNRTSVLLILGDARNNKRNPRLDLIENWCMKTRKVLWLNPEIPEKWNHGDSIIGIYMNAIKHVYDISTPARLIDVMETIII